MDKFLRDERRDGLPPMPMPMPVNGRQPLVQQSNVVDLTDDAAPALPYRPTVQPASSTARPTYAPQAFQHIPSAYAKPASQAPLTNGQPSRAQQGPSVSSPAQGWHLPPKNKHAAPSKIRMLDSTNNSTTNATAGGASDRPLPSSKHHFDARNAFKDAQDAVKKVLSGGLSQAQHSIEQAINSRMHGPHANNGMAPGRPLSVGADSDEEDLAQLPFTGPSTLLSAEEREKQLQEMLNSMVLPPDLGDIDLEEASKIEGLKCKLLPHQVAGYLWLKSREGGKYKGGILADDMGLGKTVQMLALIIGNAPTRPDTTIDRIRHEPEKKKKKKVVLDLDEAAALEKIELKSKKTLIIAPLAVVQQWARELKEKTQANLKVLVHHGTSRCKTASGLEKYDVVITSYQTVASEWANLPENQKEPKAGKKAAQKKSVIPDSSDDDFDERRAGQHSDSSDDDDSEPIRGASKPLKKKKPAAAPKAAAKKILPAPLFEVDWLRVVLDEAQNIKNYRTNAAMSCATLSRRALSKWCLSGTPIQNDAIEMFSVIRFLGIPPFNEFNEFRDRISKPLKSSNQNQVNWGMKRLCAVLKTIMLRRTKDTEMDGKPILSLPGRKIELITTDFEDEKEREFYENLQELVRTNIQKADDDGKPVKQIIMLLMLLRLRQACSHPWLVYRNVETDAAAASPQPATKEKSNGESGAADSDDDGGLTELLAGLSVKTKRCERCQIDLEPGESNKHCDACAKYMSDEKERQAWSSRSSTKIRTMMRLLDEIREAGDEKTIIFSQFTSFLDLIEPYLRSAGHNFVRYDGSMKNVDRERALERIRIEPKTRVILISFKAGNVGLNLTSCSRVILMDLWWNPMLEAQSIDRAHRLGQQRDVIVYKLVIADSVEQRILEIQEKKRALADAALEGGKLSKANRLDKKEMMYLFNGDLR